MNTYTIEGYYVEVVEIWTGWMTSSGPDMEERYIIRNQDGTVLFDRTVKRGQLSQHSLARHFIRHEIVGVPA